MIRLFRHILFVCLGMILLLSCSGRNPKSIIVWHSLRPLERRVLRNALDEFAGKYPQWDFSELFYAPETARTNFIISALGGSGPTLFWGANDNIGPFAELGVIQPLENVLQQSFIDSFLTKPIAANTWLNGHLYQIADRVGNHLCLVYNKVLVSRPPQSMNELIKMGKQLTRDDDGDGRPDHYALVWNYTEPFFAAPFIGGFGGWIVDANFQPTLNTEPVIRAAQFIYDLAHKYRIIPIECDYEIANALFKDGSAAMIINGSWSWGTYIENGIDIGIARIPKIDATGLWPTPVVSPLGYSLNVNAKGEKQKIALELLRFLTSSKIELRFTKVSGSIPSRVNAFTAPQVRDNPLVSASLNQLIVGKVLPPITEMRWVWDAMRPSYQGIFTGRVTPQQAAKDMQALALKLIKENRE